MKPALRLPLLATAALVLGIPCSSLGQSVSLDFEGTSDFANNFRNLTTVGFTQSSNGAGNDYISHDATVSFGSAAAIYDTTPGDTTTGTQSVFAVTNGLRVTLDFRAFAGNSGVGVFFADPSNSSNNVGVTINVNSSGSLEGFRYWRDGAVTAGSFAVGNELGTQSNSDGGLATNTFGTISVTLSVSGTTPTIDILAGTTSISRTYLSTDYTWTDTTILLRSSDSNAGVSPNDIDNFSISTVPEPPTYAALAGAAVLGLATLRRRRA